MIKKICLFIIILIASVGVVSAADLNDIKTLDGFTAQSDNFATNGDFGLSVKNYHESSDHDLLFENDAGYKVKVSDISNYTDQSVGHAGCLEVVEINGENVLIEFYSNNCDVDKCYEYMVQFNEMNNLKPITP